MLRASICARSMGSGESKQRPERTDRKYIVFARVCPLGLLSTERTACVFNLPKPLRPSPRTQTK